VILTESTDAVLLPAVDFAEMAAPNVAELTSPAVQVVAHRSATPPYDAKASVAGHAVAVALSVPTFAPAFTMRTELSAILLPDRSHSTWTPRMVAVAGTIAKPNPVHFR
jgi:hypothetical protein